MIDVAPLGELAPIRQEEAGDSVNDGVVPVVDLFCGCGGLSAGFALGSQGALGYHVVGALDLDAHATATFSTQIGLRPVLMDAADLLSTKAGFEVIERWRTAIGEMGVVVGGPPCQGFSAHRKKDRVLDSRNNLLLIFAQVAVALKAEFVVLENVPEIFDSKHWPHYQSARRFLEFHGYRVRARVYSLADFGVPQDRFRALVVARRGGRPFNMLSPSGRSPHRTVLDAIGHLPRLKAGQKSAGDPMHVAPSHTQRILKLISSIPKDGGSRKDAVQSMLPACHGKVDGFRDVYGRLWWDRPAISITSKSSTPSCGRFLHPAQNRNISVREAALLQGFPPEYSFEGPLTQKYRQIGNAVPPIFASAIAEHLKHQFNCLEVTDDPGEDIWHPIMKSFASSLAGIKRRRIESDRDIAKANAAQMPLSELFPAVECFSGAGGLSLGLLEAGFRPLYAFDHDKYAVATYRQNISSAVELRDAKDVSAQHVLRAAGLKKGECLLVAGGPPCQGFSQQGRGDKNDPRNTLVTWYADFLVEIDPLFFILENVTYLDSRRGREIFDGFVERLKSAGYKLHIQRLIADDYGVPQRRGRLFVVGHKEVSGLAFHFPNKELMGVSVRDAIGHIPSPPKCGDTEHRDFANHVKAKISAINELRISFVPQGGGWPDIPEHLQLDCHKAHRGDGHRDAFGRLSWDGPASTITALCDSFSRGRFAHPTEDRPISAREAAALQSFPNGFRFVGPKKDVARLIGNAVPPRLAMVVALQIRRAIETWMATNPGAAKAFLNRQNRKSQPLRSGPGRVTPSERTQPSLGF